MAGIKRLGRQLESLLTGTAPEKSSGVGQNVAWLLFDRGFRFVASFAVGVAVTRHLGPGQSGVLASVTALAALAAAGLDLGLDAILRRELAQHPAARGRLLGTATALRLAAAPVALAVFAALWLAQPAASTHAALALPLAFTALLPVALVFETWFHSQTQSRFGVWAQNSALAVSAVLRAALLATGADLLAFAWAAAAEALLVAVLLVSFYTRQGGRFDEWRADLATARALLRDAWPLALISLSALFYTRIDLVMLAALRGDAEAGHYGAAVRLTELGYIAPMILVTSLFPTLARLRHSDPSACRAQLQRLCTLVTWLGIGTTTVLTVAAPVLLRLTYGAAFAPAAGVLTLSAWCVLFACQSAARGQWILLENLQRYALWYVLIGAAVNITLNLFLIPRLGAIGAALASVLTQAVVTLVAPALFAATRPGVGFLLRAFVFRTAPPLATPT